MHSKTRAGVAALAARQTHQDQALPAEDDTSSLQRQQRQQQQQQHWVSALPKQSSSECSTAVCALEHAHAGTKRSQEAASLPTADPVHTPFKSCRVDPVLHSSPSQPGTCRQQHALTQQAAEPVKAPALGMDARLPSSACQTTPAESLSSGDFCMIESLKGQLGSSFQLQTANCQHRCCTGLHAHMHRQSSRDSGCNWAATGAASSCTNSGSPGSTTFLACVKSEPKGEEETQHQADLLLPGPEHAQQLDRRQSSHPETGETTAALRQQHQLHMIDLMLARVSAAEEAIHQGLAQPHQSDSCFQSQHGAWAPVGSGSKLLCEVESGPPGEGDFSGINSLLLCNGQQTECKLEQLAAMDDSKSNIQDASLVNQSDDMEVCTEQTHSSIKSTFDCPGRFLVPNDWLTDGSDEVGLDYFSMVSNDNSMLGLALPLMPPSLQD